MEILKIYHTQHYNDFRCLGEKCENDCCHGWKIDIDKDSYDRYMAMEGDFADTVKRSIKITSEDPFAAHFLLDENRQCPHLSAEKLCRIQLNGGVDALCRACSVYPRGCSIVGGDCEVFLELSCAEAVKIVLLHKNPLQFEETEIDIDDWIGFSNQLCPEKYTNADNGFELFWKLRWASVIILQRRQYPLWLRMVILGLFIEEADELLQQEHNDKIFEHCSKTVDRLLNGFFEPIGERLDKRDDFKLSFVETVFSPKSGFFKHEAHSQTLLEGLGFFSGEMDRGEMIAHFSHIHQTYYTPLLSENEHILENYCVYLTLKEGFPFSFKSEESVLSSYLTLASKYCLLKLILVGVSGFQKQQFSVNHIIDYIAYFSRWFDHDKNFPKKIANFLQNNNANNVGVMGALMKE